MSVLCLPWLVLADIIYLFFIFIFGSLIFTLAVISGDGLLLATLFNFTDIAEVKNLAPLLRSIITWEKNDADFERIWQRLKTSEYLFFFLIIWLLDDKYVRSMIPEAVYHAS